MNITKILNDKETSNEAKLDAIAEIVAGAREDYGNSDVEISEVKVNTCHGCLPFASLEDDSKIEILRNEALSMKSRAIAYVEENQGTVLKKVVQELLATNSFFVNVSSGTEFEYL